VIVERLETEMKDINSNSEALKRNFLDLTELRHILSKTHNFFEEVINTWVSAAAAELKLS